MKRVEPWACWCSHRHIKHNRKKWYFTDKQAQMDSYIRQHPVSVVHRLTNMCNIQKTHFYVHTVTGISRHTKNTYTHIFILLLLSHGMALSSYSTPMGKVLGIREARRGRQTDRQGKQGTSDSRKGREKEGNPELIYICPCVCVCVYESVCWCNKQSYLGC